MTLELPELSEIERLADTLAPSASIGPAVVSWYVITLVLFFIPYGLITAELGAAYPEQGGLYVWVRNAFGDILLNLLAHTSGCLGHLLRSS